MRTGSTMAMAVLLALTVATTAAAQQRPAGPPQDEAIASGPAGRTEGGREAARRKIEAVRIARMTEALGLDDREVIQFIPAISLLEQQRREIAAAHRHAMMEIRQELGSPTPDEAKLRASLDRLRKAHQDLMELTARDFETAQEMLSVRQQARYVVFQQDFLREVRRIIGEMRGDRRRHGDGPRDRDMRR